ncbi:MAG: hypothetical protein ACLQQB_05465 [Solirubrobacteraceae bacterium]|jgi:uncharacterized protein
MISKKELQHSISEARVKAQACADEVAAAQDRLAEAQREERLLVELAQLRGWSDDEFESLAAEPTADARANGTGETRRRTPSPMRTALLAAVIDVLNERGEPTYIGDLMTALHERSVEIPGSGQQANVIAHISRDERIVRPQRGFYGLREWGLTDTRTAHGKSKRTRPASKAKA